MVTETFTLSYKWLTTLNKLTTKSILPAMRVTFTTTLPRYVVSLDGAIGRGRPYERV